MADHYYGVNIGAGLAPNGVSTGTSSTAKSIELRVHDAVTGMSKVEVLKALEALAAYIETHDAPA